MTLTTQSKMDSTIRTVITAVLLLAHQAFLDEATIASAAEPSRLRVLCYNIHYGQGTDSRYDLKRLAAVINKANFSD